MKEFSRRDFIKLGIVGLSSALLAGSSPENFTAPSLPEKPIHKNQGVLFIMPTLKNVVDDTLNFEDTVGHRVHGLSFFADLDEKLPTEKMIGDTLNSGRAIMINLQPRPTRDALDLKDYFSNRAFLFGKHDEKLKELAIMMSGFGKNPIFIRFAFEMNGNWFSWSGDANGFVKTWRRVVNIFRENGATNVKWIFSPNYLPYPESVINYYPGDSYVDVVGADIYDWEGLSPAFAINRINYFLKEAALQKPLIVGELGSARKDRDGWLSEAIVKNLRQGASAINYFQINKEKNWKLENKKEIPKIRSLMDSGVFLEDYANLETINKAILTVN